MKAPVTSEPASRQEKKPSRLSFLNRHKKSEPNVATSMSPESPESSTTSPAKTGFWPAEEAPSKLPGARIWTYGYNADVLGGLFQANNKNSIRQHGNDLMVKMERKIQGNVSRHPLGLSTLRFRIRLQLPTFQTRHPFSSLRIAWVGSWSNRYAPSFITCYKARGSAHMCSHCLDLAK